MMSTLPPSELPHGNVPGFFVSLLETAGFSLNTHHLTDCLLSVSDCYCHAERPTNPRGLSTSLITQLIISKFIFLRTEVSILNFYSPYA